MKDDEFADLLDRATRDVPGDVARVAAEAGARGRRSLRRRRAGSILAAAGVTAAVAFGVTVPDWGGSDPVQVAEDGPGVAGSPSATPPPRQQPQRPDRPITIDAEDVPQLVGEAAGAEEIGPLLDEHPYPRIAEDQELILHFRLDGTLTTVVIEPSRDRATCRELAHESEAERRLRDGDRTPSSPRLSCRLVDGVQVGAVTTGSIGSDVKVGSASAWNHGYKVDVVSYNVAAGKNADGSEDVPALRSTPRIDGDTLVELATSEAWFK